MQITYTHSFHCFGIHILFRIMLLLLNHRVRNRLHYDYNATESTDIRKNDKKKKKPKTQTIRVKILDTFSPPPCFNVVRFSACRKGPTQES